jgi:hypothetical protein
MSTIHNLDEWKKSFSGNCILPDDDRYEHARMAYITKGSPAVVFQPHTAQDAARALKFVRESGLLLSVRSGGHNGAGFGTNDGGAVIDLSLLNSIEVIDAERRIVRIGSGATWGLVAKTLGDHGLALSSGDAVSVGVGGLALGGGIGWMVRKYGLAIDSLIAAEVLTAEGNVIRTSGSEHPDLFWAIRGGGGNFGIVTSFEFTALPVNTVVSGMIMYTLEGLPELIRGWRDCMRSAPDELTTTLLLMPSFAGNPPMAMVLCCYADGDEQAAAAAIGPLLKIGSVTLNTVMAKPYASVLEEAHPPEGVKIMVNNGFTENISEDLISVLAAVCCQPGSPVVQMRSLGGAMNRIDPGATAFAHRNKEALIIAATFAPMNSTDTELAAALGPWRAMEPFISGSYVNFFTSATATEVAASYPQRTYERLAAVKAAYDPGNIFNRNYNVTPAAK